MNQPLFFKDIYKISRRKKPVLRVVPTRQRLISANFSVEDVNNGLIVNFDIFVCNRRFVNACNDMFTKFFTFTQCVVIVDKINFFGVLRGFAGNICAVLSLDGRNFFLIRHNVNSRLNHNLFTVFKKRNETSHNFYSPLYVKIICH